MQDPTFESTRQGLLQLARQAVKDGQDADPGSQSLLQRDLTEQVSCRLGDASCAGAHADKLNKSAIQPAPETLQRLQRQYGNRFVQRVVDLARRGEGEASVTPEVEQAIHGARGGGQPLDTGARAQLEPAFGADFGGVRVHADGQADTLNRALSARAFTTGQDIFFKQGEYNPGSSGGRELLAHELTHVVQQNGSQVQTKLTLGAPGDRYEQEADNVARAVMQQEQQPKPAEEEEKDKAVQGKLEANNVQRQPEEEKDETGQEAMQAKFEVTGTEQQAQA